MFDQLDNNNAAPTADTKPLGPSYRPVAPAPAASTAPVPSARTEDIFAEVDKSVKPEVFRPGQDNIPPRGTVLPPATGWKSNKIMIFGLLFGGLIIIVAGGYVGLKLAVKSNQAVNNSFIQEQPDAQEISEITSAGEEVEEADNIIEPIQPVVEEPSPDSDQDGLTDREEADLGTDSYNPDTDNDGLTDREEAKVYKTDALSADTDGDGYQDGAEVTQGYNPLGPGKLLEIK